MNFYWKTFFYIDLCAFWTFRKIFSKPKEENWWIFNAVSRWKPNVVCIFFINKHVSSFHSIFYCVGKTYVDSSIKRNFFSASMNLLRYWSFYWYCKSVFLWKYFKKTLWKHLMIFIIIQWYAEYALGIVL